MIASAIGNLVKVDLNTFNMNRGVLRKHMWNLTLTNQWLVNFASMNSGTTLSMKAYIFYVPTTAAYGFLFFFFFFLRNNHSISMQDKQDSLL